MAVVRGLRGPRDGAGDRGELGAGHGRGGEVLGRPVGRGGRRLRAAGEAAGGEERVL